MAKRVIDRPLPAVEHTWPDSLREARCRNGNFDFSTPLGPSVEVAWDYPHPHPLPYTSDRFAALAMANGSLVWRVGKRILCFRTKAS